MVAGALTPQHRRPHADPPAGLRGRARSTCATTLAQNDTEPPVAVRTSAIVVVLVWVRAASTGRARRCGLAATVRSVRYRRCSTSATNSQPQAATRLPSRGGHDLAAGRGPPRRGRTSTRAVRRGPGVHLRRCHRQRRGARQRPRRGPARRPTPHARPSSERRSLDGSPTLFAAGQRAPHRTGGPEALRSAAQTAMVWVLGLPPPWAVPF